jgi:hypothetical protein
MATRRRKVKHSHNKTRTTSKALLRKTRHKNKKNKNCKTKKRYQSGGVPKAPKASAKGASGIKVEPKVTRSLRRQGMGHIDIEERQKKFQKENPTAEFDIPVEISGLDYNISVKSVKRKTPGQNSFSIMCGDARRFFTQVGIGKVPYHMIIGIRQKHPTKPDKKQILGFEIDLRKSRSLLFGNADDCTIRRIVKRADELTDSYYKDEVGTKPIIDEFNEYLKSLGSKMQLAPKIGNPDKKRATRLQASFSYKTGSPNTDAASKLFSLSSEENTPEDGDGEGEAATATAMVMSRGQSAQPSQRLAPVKTLRPKISKKSNKPTEVQYFQEFKPRVRRSELPAGPAGAAEEGTLMSQPPQAIHPSHQPMFVQASSAGPAFFSAIPPVRYLPGFPEVDYEAYGSLQPMHDVGFASSPAFSPKDR